MFKHFQAKHKRTPLDELLVLLQTNLVHKHQGWSKLLSLTVDDMNEETLTNLFLNGLSNDIKAQTKLFQSGNIEEAMQCVVKVEAKNEIIDGRFGIRFN